MSRQMLKETETQAIPRVFKQMRIPATFRMRRFEACALKLSALLPLLCELGLPACYLWVCP